MHDINLLPWRFWKYRKQTLYFYIIGISSLLIHITLWIVYLQQLQHSHLKWEQEYQQINKQRIKQELEFLPISREIKLSKQLQQRDLETTRLYHGLMTLSQILPSEAVLIKIEYKDHQWMISGLTDQFNILFVFLEKIKKSNFFHKVVLTHLEQESHVRFLIQATESN